MAVEEVYVILADAPGPGEEQGRFVEIETADGRSVHVEGEWAGVPADSPVQAPWRIGPLYMQTGEGSPGVTAERSVRARLAANEMIALIDEHERVEHGGEGCVEERAGMAAFVMHSLGLRQEHLRQVGYALAVYGEHHHDHGVHDEHSHG